MLTQVPTSAAAAPTGLRAVSTAGLMAWPVRLLLVYLAAITIFGKGPTYIGYPPIYWGELVLLSCLLWLTSRRSFTGLTSSELKPLSAFVLLFALVGAGMTLVSLPSGEIDALRDSAIWYYAAFYFVGLNLAARPLLADRVWQTLRYIWMAAVCWGLLDYASGFVVYGGLSNMGPVYPWRNVTLLSNSQNELAQHVALGSIMVLLMRPIPRLRAWHPLLAGAGVLGLIYFVGARGRGVKVALCLGALAVVVILLGRGRRARFSAGLARLGATGLVLLLVAGLMWPTIWEATRLDRFQNASPDFEEGTAYWRMIWWERLADEVMSRNPAFGLGFGETLGVYNPLLFTELSRREQIRSPHNINVSIFARMGLVGITLWTGVLICGIGGLFVRLWKGGSRKGPYTSQQNEELLFWLLMLVATWVNSSFGVLMEGPVLGVWFWFALGFASGRSLCVSAKPVLARCAAPRPRPMRVVFGVSCAS